MKIFKKPANSPLGTAVVQTGQKPSKFNILTDDSSTIETRMRLYDTLRDSVPIIDAAIIKIIRLTGGYKVKCTNSSAQTALDDFVQNVNVSGVSMGLESFICSYLDSLLLYGNAIGEIVMDRNRRNIIGLYNAKVSDVTLKAGDNPLNILMYTTDENGDEHLVNRKDLIIHTALNAKPTEIYGCSILKGLPFVSSVLLKVYESISQNFDRVGNIRYAVTYKPSSDSVDKAYAKERAMQIAKEWSDGMNATKNGQVTDFISVGDVSIKVIGADNQLIDTNIPVRQMLEQIIAKLGIPPFLLGLSWSSTERMSKQQCDILTSELDYYRRLLNPIIMKICKTFLAVNGFDEDLTIEWQPINLQDEAELSKSALYKAQAEKIQHEIEKEV